MKNILITSISAKILLIKAVFNAKQKFDSSIRILGSDANINCIAQYFVDDFIYLPPLCNFSIITFLDLCAENAIGYVIPTRDEDVLFFAKYKDQLIDHNIYIMAPNYNAVELCNDKLLFYKKTGLLAIKTSKQIEKFDVMYYVVKERFGSGSKLLGLKLTKEEAIIFAEQLENPIFQPFIEGKEYSIDSYVDQFGRCIGSIVRSRDLIQNGEAIITQYQEKIELENLSKQFVEKFKLFGHSVLQAIETPDGKFHMIECNARFGGASTLSIAMGLDSFYWFLCETRQIPFSFHKNDKKLKQIRVQDDTYFEC